MSATAPALRTRADAQHGRARIHPGILTAQPPAQRVRADAEQSCCVRVGLQGSSGSQAELFGGLAGTKSPAGKVLRVTCSGKAA